MMKSRPQDLQKLLEISTYLPRSFAKGDEGANRIVLIVIEIQWRLVRRIGGRVVAKMRLC